MHKIKTAVSAAVLSSRFLAIFADHSFDLLYPAYAHIDERAHTHALDSVEFQRVCAVAGHERLNFEVLFAELGFD
jgi:hypothetical protein